jgi:hypothetical protein
VFIHWFELLQLNYSARNAECEIYHKITTHAQKCFISKRLFKINALKAVFFYSLNPQEAACVQAELRHVYVPRCEHFAVEQQRVYILCSCICSTV